MTSLLGRTKATAAAFPQSPPSSPPSSSSSSPPPPPSDPRAKPHVESGAGKQRAKGGAKTLAPGGGGKRADRRSCDFTRWFDLGREADERSYGGNGEFNRAYKRNDVSMRWYNEAWKRIDGFTRWFNEADGSGMGNHSLNAGKQRRTSCSFTTGLNEKEDDRSCSFILCFNEAGSCSFTKWFNEAQKRCHSFTGQFNGAQKRCHSFTGQEELRLSHVGRRGLHALPQEVQRGREEELRQAFSGG